jgi:hypothetical protein
MMNASGTRWRSLLGAAVALWLPAAVAGDITVYQQSDFRGDSLTLQRAAPDLEGKSGLNNIASSAIVRSGVWQACSQAYFNGTCVRLTPGQYNAFEGTLGDGVASVREVLDAPPSAAIPVEKPRIALFERPDFVGQWIELTNTHGDLDTIGSYGGARAVIVYSGTWRLCSRDHYRGDCSDFGPGRYDSLGALGDRVASAELISMTAGPVSLVAPPPSPARVVLYEFPHFGGRSLVIDRDELPNLERMEFLDRAGSMRIEGGHWMLCTDTNFEGDCRTFGPGEYARLPHEVDGRIASARRVPDVYGMAE